jgi:hypothetical protein
MPLEAKAFHEWLNQSRREGSTAGSLSFLDRGLSSSPFRENAPRVYSLLNAPLSSRVDERFSSLSNPFPTRRQPLPPMQPLTFLSDATTHACLAVLDKTPAGLEARWYGRQADVNTGLWSASKSVNALAVLARLGSVGVEGHVSGLRLHNLERPHPSMSLGDVLLDITSYRRGDDGSNAAARTLGRLLGNRSRTEFLHTNTGREVSLCGFYGGALLFERPVVALDTGAVVLTSPETDDVKGLNRLSVSDLTRLHVQASFHRFLTNPQRIESVSDEALSTWTWAMAHDPARYVDVACDHLGLMADLEDVAIATKLGFGQDSPTEPFEAVYSGVVQFTERRSGRLRAMSLTLKATHPDAVLLDCSLAADVCAIVRRLVDDAL